MARGVTPPPSAQTDVPGACFVADPGGNDRAMWLFFFVLPLAIVMLIGGLLAGGIFTIVFLPIALIIVAVAIASTMYGTSRNRRTLPRDRSTAPAPNTGHTNVAAAPSSPGELTDARRQVQ